MKKYICENCGKESDEKFGSGRFCSLSCSRSFIAKKRHADGKFANHLDKLHKSRRKIHSWKCSVCNAEFETRILLDKHKKEMNHIIGGPGALKGKTKETSVICQKISEKLKISYATGNIVHPFKGKHLSASHKEKISEGRQRTLDTNLKCGRRIDVGWYKAKNLNGDEFTVRGHWEENVANKLTEMSILWIRNKRLKYFNEYWHTYTPDFYLPALNAFIEVKGYYPDEDKLKMQLVLKYNPDVKVYFIGQCQYKEFLDNGILKNEYLMKLD